MWSPLNSGARLPRLPRLLLLGAALLLGPSVLAADPPMPAPQERSARRREQIATLETARESSAASGDELAGVLHHLGELYRDEAACLEADPSADPAEVAALRARAVEALRGSLRAAPAGADAGELEIELGVALVAAGQDEQGEAQLNRALNAHPYARDVPDAHRALGDVHLRRRELTEAWQRYSMAATYVEHPRYPEALFGLSRVQRQGGEPEQAVWTLERLMERHPTEPLRQQALDDLEQLFAKLGQTEVAQLYFGRIQEPERAARASAAGAGRAGGEDLALLTQSETASEAELSGVALRLLAESTARVGGKGGAELRARAIEATRLTLDRYPEAPQAVELRYRLAELLSAMHRDEDAWPLYMEALHAAPTGPLAQASAMGALFSADEVYDHERHLGLPSVAADNPVEARTPTVWASRTVQACDAYARLSPEEPQTTNILLKATYILYEYNQFSEAELRLRELLTRAPETPETPDSRQAAELLLDAYSNVEDWTRLRDLSSFLLGLPRFGDAALRTELAAIHEATSRKLGLSAD